MMKMTFKNFLVFALLLIAGSACAQTQLINKLEEIPDVAGGQTNGQVPIWNSTTERWEPGSNTGSGLSSVADDTSPQLGGFLDVNGHGITNDTTGVGIKFDTAEIELFGNVGIGAAASSPASILEVKVADIGNRHAVRVYNSDSTDTGSHSAVDILTTPTGGDPLLRFGVTTAQDWSMGIDNSSSDEFGINSYLDFTTQRRLTIETGGDGIFYGDFDLGAASGTSPRTLGVFDGGSDNEPGALVLYDDGGDGLWLFQRTDGTFAVHTSYPTDDDADGSSVSLLEATETFSGDKTFSTSATFSSGLSLGGNVTSASDISLIPGSSSFVNVGSVSSTDPQQLRIHDGGADNEPGILMLFDDGGGQHTVFVDTGGDLRFANTGTITDDDADGTAVVLQGDSTSIDDLTINGGTITPANAMGALAIDTGELLNTKSIAANSTFTFSGAPSTDAWFGLTVTNTSSSAVTATIPSSYSSDLNTYITSFEIQGNQEQRVVWNYNGTIYRIYGAPYSINDLAADASPDGAADYVETYNASEGTSSKVLLNNLPSGSGGAFSDSSDPVVLNTTTKDVHIGDGAGTLSGKLEIGGDADQPQLVVEAHSTQTDSVFVIQDDADTEVFTVEDDGTVVAAGSITGTGTAGVIVGNGATSAGAVRWLEDSSTGSDYMQFRAASSIGTSFVLTWPADDGEGGDVLETDGTGQLSWENRRFESYAVADLSDTTTPSVLTDNETQNKLISNYKASGADHVFTMPAATSRGNVTFVVGDEFQVDIEPDTGENFYLNGTAMAANEHIQNTADTLGDTIVGVCVNVNGSYVWMFKSDNSNWVEETP